MTTKLRTLKRAVFAACCVAGLATTPAALASGFGISVGTGPIYYNGYAYPRSHCWRNYYGQVVCRGPYYYNSPVYYDDDDYGYYSPGYYNSGYYSGGFYYSNGFRDRDDHRWQDRDDRRWQDRDDRRWRQNNGDRDGRRDRDDHDR